MTFSTFASPGVSLQGGGGGGSGGTPGGSTTQIQYNNAGAFAGASGLTTNGTNLTLGSASQLLWSTDLIFTRKAAANFRFGAADAAAAVPQTLSVQSVVAGTTNTAGAALTITGSQGTGSGVGGAIIFQVAVAGAAPTVQNTLVTAWSISGSGNILAGTDNTYDIGASGATRPRNVYVAGEAVVGDNSGNSGKLTIGIGIGRGLYFGNRGCISAVNDGVFALQNNATTDFGRLQFGGTTPSFPALKRNGAGIDVVGADGTNVSFVRVPGVAVASLPSASTAGVGARSFVTDATATTYASTVAGGGANKVPVFSDGTNWIIG